MKTGQSLIDFMNILPLQSVLIRQSPLTNKEAKILFSIWEGDRDPYGHLVVSSTVDPFIVTSLTTKGMLKNKMSGYALGEQKTVEITKKGQEVIRNIVLHKEDSSFDKSSSGDFNYEAIHTLSEKGTNKQSKTKTASSQKTHNWFERLIWKSF